MLYISHAQADSQCSPAQAMLDISQIDAKIRIINVQEHAAEDRNWQYRRNMKITFNLLLTLNIMLDQHSPTGVQHLKFSTERE
jgi:hypothetical protein